jgi:hypothetical protein
MKTLFCPHQRSSAFTRGCLLSFAAVVAASASPALAWDCHGHRAITLLALDGLHEIAPDAPAFLKDDAFRMMAASNACEPDRYRSIRIPFMAHENNPDHYLDVEKLTQFGLTLETVPPLRNEYLRAMIIAKHEHPDNVDPYNELMDPMRQQEWPGFAAHAVMEHYSKLTASFKTWRILQELNEPGRVVEVDAARGNILANLGHLSHFVGDLAQPLHTTTHHHGWIGDNPGGYTTDRRIHAYIDGDILVTHQLDHAALRPGCVFDRRVEAANPWNDAIEHIRRSHEKVEPLYILQKTGELEQEPGKAFIVERLQDGGRTLAAFYAAAWSASAITDSDVRDFVRYDAWGPVSELKRVPPLPRGRQDGGAPAPEAPAPAPASAPSTTPAAKP